MSDRAHQEDYHCPSGKRFHLRKADAVSQLASLQARRESAPGGDWDRAGVLSVYLCERCCGWHVGNRRAVATPVTVQR